MQQRSRLEGLDLAWLLALAGIVALPAMVAAAPPGPVDWWWRLLDGPPLALFVMLFGIDLLRRAAPRLAARDRDGAVRAALARGLWVALLGATLATFGAMLSGAASAGLLLGAFLPVSGVTVWVPDLARSGELLGPLGVALGLAAPLLIAPTWGLAVAAVLLAALSGPVVMFFAITELSLPGGIDAYGFLVVFVRDVLVTGAHPALPLLTLIALGMLVMRLLEQAQRGGGPLLLRLLLLGVGGVAMAAAGLAVEPLVRPLLAVAGETEGFVSAAALSYGTLGFGSPVHLLWTVGIASVALAATGLLGALLPAPALRLLVPMLAAGRAPFTSLLVHLLLAALLAGLAATAPVVAVGWGSAAIQVAAILIVGAVLAALRRRGPLEALIDQLSELYGGLLPGRTVLEHVLPDDTSIEYSRSYRAPIERVWQAITEPAQVMRWLSDPAVPMRACTMDVRPGGGFRYEWELLLQQGAIGGHYRWVQAPTMLVTEVHPPGGERAPYATVDRLVAHGEITVHHVRDVFASTAERDAAVLRLPQMAAALERLASHLERGLDSHAEEAYISNRL